jgi:hypothetical protein
MAHNAWKSCGTTLAVYGIWQWCLGFSNDGEKVAKCGKKSQNEKRETSVLPILLSGVTLNRLSALGLQLFQSESNYMLSNHKGHNKLRTRLFFMSTCVICSMDR